jgi:hypothetical protein
MVDFLEKGFLPKEKVEEFRALVIERASRVGI